MSIFKKSLVVSAVVIALVSSVRIVWATEMVREVPAQSEQLKAQPVPETEEEMANRKRLSAGLKFTPLDASTDQAYFSNGDKALRLYDQPRLTYVDNGTVKVRPDGWNIFTENSKSKLRATGQGYEFAAPLSDAGALVIKSGKIEITNGRAAREIPMEKAIISATKKNTIDQYYLKNIYPGFDIYFNDAGKSRQKFIAITDKPKIEAGETLVVWEEYDLPDGAEVVALNGRSITGRVDDVQGEVLITLRNGESMAISGAMIYDASLKDINAIELQAEALKQIVEVDTTKQKMRIGLKVFADYLLAPERQYPVTIDPTYTTVCLQGSGTCNTNQVYLRYMTSSNILAGQSTAYLLLGYYSDATGPATRQPVIGFMQNTSNYFPNLSSNGTLTNATLHLTRSENAGIGATTGTAVPTQVMKITTAWDKNTVTYGNPGVNNNGIHNYLTAVPNATANIERNIGSGAEVTWNITSLVSDWMAGQANNGLYISPTPHWTSGSVPSWPQRIFWFRSSTWGSSGGPYIDLTFSGKPDLTDNGSDVSSLNVQVNQTASIIFRIKNNSTEAITQSSVIKYWVNPVSNCTGRVNYLGSVTVPTLGANGTYSTTVNYTPSTAGTYCIQFDIDANGSVAEANESNNNFYIPNFTVTEAAKPDITPNSFTVDNSHIYYTGNTFSTSVVVRNIGSVTANNVPYILMLKDAVSGNLYDFNCGGGTITVPANSANSYPISCTLPTSLGSASASYYVRFQADHTGVISESDETNNSSQSTNTIVVEQFNYNGAPGGTADPNGNTVPLDAKLSAINGLAAKAQTLSLQNKNTYKVQNKIVADTVAKNYAADPVNIRTGAFEFSQTDFALTGLSVPVEFVRTYNSKYIDQSVRFGRGWSNSYHMFYYQNPTTQEVQIYLGGAQVSYFTPSGDGVTFVAERGDFNTLYKENNYLVYKTSEGIIYRFSEKLFDSIAVLKEIEDTNGNKTILGYTDVRGVELLSSITDASGRSITFVYPSDTSAAGWDKVKEIHETISGVDRLVARYTYNANLDLTSVHYESTYASEGVRNFDYTFTYDANGLMTSYTDARGVILYNEYDTTNSANATTYGRVLRQYEHNPRVDGSNPAVKRLVYELTYTDSADAGVPGSTHCTVTQNFRSASTNYAEKICFNADELKIYREQGGVVERWTYNTDGQVATYVDGSNNTKTYEYDAKRRLIKETAPDTNWRTVTAYEYENTFNRITKKTETYSPVSNPGAIVATKVHSYTIDAKGNVVTHQDPENAIERFEYNPNGTLKKYTDKRNQITNYTYNGNGYRLTESKDITLVDGTAQSIVKKFAYDNYGRVLTTTDPVDYSHYYAYDSRGWLRKITNPYGHTKLFEYDAAGHQTKITDESGHVTEYVFDTDIAGSLLSTIKRSATGDIVTTREYDYVGNVTKDSDALNRQTTYSYNSANRVVSKVDPHKTTTYEYYGNGQLKKETTSAGTRVDYFYDTRGNKIEARNYYSANNFITTTWEYDGFNRLTKETNGNNQSTTYTYDGLDRVLTKTNAAGGVTSYRYDANGNKTGERSPLAHINAALRNSDGQSVTQEFDGDNRVMRVINAENKQTKYWYDQSGNVIKKIDWQDADGSNASHVTQFEYDSLNRLVHEMPATGGHVWYQYTNTSKLKYIMDELNRVTRYTFDDFDRMLTEKDSGNKITTYAYDAVGNKTLVTYPDGTKTTYEYNTQNKVSRVIDQLGGIHGYGYDALGNLISEVDKNNHETTYSYDKLNRLVGESNAQSIASSYTYDANNNRVTQTVAGKTTAFEYDALNRVTTITYPGNKTESSTYDLNNNKVTVTNGTNQTTTYTYDALNRAVTKNAGSAVTYGYDNWGNLTSLSDVSGTTTYTYNARNLVVGENKTFTGLANKNFAITKTYDLDGRLKTLTDAANKTITYAYDNRAKLSAVGLGAQNLATYTYTAFGKPDTISYGNGVTTVHTYDGLQRVQSIVTKNSAAQVLWSEQYTYDAQSNRATMTDHTGRSVSYAYDSLDQLTGATYTVDGVQSTITYAYDTAGNRTALNTPMGNTNYQYLAGTNELTQVSNNDLIIGVQFNANGSLQKETHSKSGVNQQTIDYAYTPDNRLSGITYHTVNTNPTITADVADKTISFAYDDFGNRTRKTINGSESTYYFNQGLTVLHEIDTAGTVVKSIVQGVGQVAEISAAGAITYTHQDVLGSTALLTNETGVVVGEYDYDAFGAIIGHDGADTNYTFTNQEYDAESELYYFNARYYNPALGRFISRDPLLGSDGDFLSRNQYVYAKNNPLKYIDPTGEDPVNLISANGVRGMINGVKQGAYATWDGLVSLYNHPIDTVIDTGKAIGGMYKDAYDDAKYLYNRTSEVGFTGLWNDTKYSASVLSDGWNSMSSYEKGNLIGYSTEKVAELYLGAKGGGSSLGKSVINVEEKINPLSGVQYTPKVLKQMIKDEYHGFPNVVDNFGSSGKITPLTGGDGVVRTKLEINGSLNGKNGIFEYIIEPNNSVNHRLFKPFE